MPTVEGVLNEKSNEELARLFNERMTHNYLQLSPVQHYNYPNTFDGDCLKIAHVLALRIERGEKHNENN